MPRKFFRKCGIASILLAITMVVASLAGCIQSQMEALSPQSSGNHTDKNFTGRGPTTAEVDFQAAVSSIFFKAWGNLILQGDSSLPYLILNATLFKDGMRVDGARYMLIEIEPGQSRPFDLTKSKRLRPGDYRCFLEVLGPSGVLASEARECQVIGLISPEIEQYPLPRGSDWPWQRSMDEEASARAAEAQDGPLEAEESEEGRVQAEAARTQGADEVQAVVEVDSRDKPTSGENQSPSADLLVGPSGYQLVGSKSSDKYHMPSCPYAAKIKQKVYFQSSKEAEERGYKPCKSCKPS